MSYNKVILMGNLTRDPEMRSVGSGTNLTKFGLAMNRRYTADGEKREEVTFVECIAWGKTAELIYQHLSKGKPILVEGRLKLEQWEDKTSGQKRSKHVVVVESFQFVGPKTTDDTPRAAATQYPDDDGETAW